MAHEITRTDTPIFAEKRAWHGLGTVLEDAPSIPGALRLAGLDWEVEAWPISATNGETRQTIDSHVLNVRGDTGAPLGVVGSGYVPLQNSELADFADALMGEGARVESAGSLRGGKRVWFLIRTDEIVELGRNGDDRVIPYVLLANGHDGGLAFTVKPTTIRVVCANTLHASLRNERDAQRALKLRHTSGIKFRVEDAKRVLEGHGLIVKSWREKAQALAAAPMTRAERSAYYESVYAAAFAKPESDRGKARRTNVLREWESLSHSDRNTLDGVGGTAWGALNAVTDWSDHRSGGEKISRDERTYRGWFGSGAKLKAHAWDEALATL